MSATICLTCCPLANLAGARVLAETVRAAHPDWRLHAVLLDPPGHPVPRSDFAPFDQVTSVLDLDTPRAQTWLFGLDQSEARLPAAATAIAALLEEGADQVLYLDADSAIFHPLALPADASIILVPHHITPGASAAARRDGELTALRQGIFSPGILAVRRDANGLAFATWFARMAQTPPVDPRLAAVPVAPLLCNLAPGLFDGLHLLRDPGVNVAGINISERRVRVTRAGDLTVNGHPLRHFQFPLPGSAEETALERHGHGDIALYELLNWYRRARARLHVAAAMVPWGFNRFADGSPITPPIRALWRARADLRSAFEDPFASGPETFQAWLAREQPDLA